MMKLSKQRIPTNMATNALSGLPAFFQTTTKTVLDELADFELGGGIEDDGAVLGDEDTADRDIDTFGDTSGGFGDLNADSLPAFFKKASASEQEHYDLYDSMANQTLDDSSDIASAAMHLPPGARVSTTYPQTNQPPVQRAMPPGLSPAPAKAAPPAPVNYKDLLAAMGSPVVPPPMTAPVVAPQAPVQTAPAAPAARAPAPISYARAVAPAGAAGPVAMDPQVMSGPPAVPYGPPAVPLQPQQANAPPAPAGAFMREHPAYVLNPPLPPAPTALPRGTSGGSVLSQATANTHSTGFSAQRPLLYNSNTGFTTPTAVPAGNYHGTAPQYRKELPKGKFMTPSDVRYVVNRVLQPMETTDPFADDFYFLQLSIKKNAAAREAALKEQAALPNPIYVPLPVWKETKERIRMQMEAMRQSCHERSREWEQKEQVLGHQVRSDIHRPREQLRMPSLADLEAWNDADDEGGDGELKAPFSSRLWTMRRAVQRGYEALYTVQELQHLLSSPLIASNPAAHAEICREIESAIALLSQSLGIRTSAPPPPVPGAPVPLEPEITLDGGHVGAILQTAIGRKLMTRSLKLLSPPHRWALLPVILAKILLSPPAQDPPAASASGTTAAAAAATAAGTNDALAVEQRLLRTIIEFLQFSYQFQLDQQRQCPPGAIAVFTNVLLVHLRHCIKAVMVTQMEKSKLRQALISERTRAEVMHIVVQIGDKVKGSAEPQLAVEWDQTREAFMAMLED